MDLTSVRWRKSSYSGDNGGNCVEVAAKCDLSASSDMLCLVRDSKDPEGPGLVFASGAWRRFTEGLRAGA
jgi:hypothetical protein